MKKIDFDWMEIIVLTLVLVFFVFGYESFESWIYSVWPSEIGMVAHYSLPKLTFEFISVSLLSGLAAAGIGILIGVFCDSKVGSSFQVIIENIAMIMQTIPIMALLMFAIIAFGVGVKAAVFSLVFQSMLPVIFETIAGLKSIPYTYVEAGRGVGMTDVQILTKVKIPMALPVILSGVRASVIICISAATLAFNTGAGGLGLLIQTGIATYNTVFVFEGTVPICLLAVIADKILRKIEKNMYKVSAQ